MCSVYVVCMEGGGGEGVTILVSHDMAGWVWRVTTSHRASLLLHII